MAKNKAFLKLLKDKGYNYSSLSQKIGVSDMAVRHWINGRNRPSMISIMYMAKLFNMSIESVYSLFKNI